MEAIDTRDWLGHVIVCGLQGLGVRIVELLQSAGIRVVVVGNAGEDHHLRLVQALDVPRIDGSPLVYNQSDTYMPDLLICRKEHADRVLSQVAELA